MTAAGRGNASVWFGGPGLEAELDGALEFDFLGRTFEGFGHGTGALDILAISGWAWAVVWGRTLDRPAAEVCGGLVVEGSPALGSGSVQGTCYFVLRQAGARTDYRGTFVTQASPHLAPPSRQGTLSLEGDLALAFTLTPCSPTDGFPWDPGRWPAELLREFLQRVGS